LRAPESLLGLRSFCPRRAAAFFSPVRAILRASHGNEDPDVLVSVGEIASAHDDRAGEKRCASGCAFDSGVPGGMIEISGGARDPSFPAPRLPASAPPIQYTLPSSRDDTVSHLYDPLPAVLTLIAGDRAANKPTCPSRCGEMAGEARAPPAGGLTNPSMHPAPGPSKQRVPTTTSARRARSWRMPPTIRVALKLLKRRAPRLISGTNIAGIIADGRRSREF
jgi:hypothetical protein